MNSKEFARRRKHLMELIGANGIAVLAAAPERVRSRDTLYIYRADSDFYYLTGFREPEAVAVLVPGRAQGEFLVFCRERNPDRELWDGPRAGPEGAVAEFGADDAFPITDLDDILPGLLERSDRVYYSLGAHEFDQRLHLLLERRIVGRQQRFELEPGLLEHARARRDEVRERCAELLGCVELLILQAIFEPIRGGRCAPRAQRAAHAAVQFRERDDGAGLCEGIAQRVVVERRDGGFVRHLDPHVVRIRMLTPASSLLTVKEAGSILFE